MTDSPSLPAGSGDAAASADAIAPVAVGKFDSEVDRLFGELNKVHALANLDISDEVLDARMQQAIAVSQNRAWKLLLRK